MHQIKITFINPTEKNVVSLRGLSNVYEYLQATAIYFYGF